MSSIGSNGDSSLNYDLNCHDLKDKLKVQFLEQPLKESLLVLDEVNDRKCLNAFDIGCKILITTRDTGVIDNYQTQIIKVINQTIYFIQNKHTVSLLRVQNSYL